MHTHTLDASSILHAWDNYPISQFPKMWDWLGAEVQAERVSIPAVALKEVADSNQPCSSWLQGHQVRMLAIGTTELTFAADVKSQLGIVGDGYHAKGVSENDLLIIACAKTHGVKLITNEGLQFVAPVVESRRKIPSVCDLPSVQVRHLNFLQYIQASQQVF